MKSFIDGAYEQLKIMKEIFEVFIFYIVSILVFIKFLKINHSAGIDSFYNYIKDDILKDVILAIVLSAMLFGIASFIGQIFVVSFNKFILKKTITESFRHNRYEQSAVSFVVALALTFYIFGTR